MEPGLAYGTTRTRGADVSYGQIEAVAQAILLAGVRPTVDGVREALQAGSQRTLLSGLQRFWKELGERLAGVPDSRRRLPAAVADLADSLWQTALTLAIDAAEGSDTAIKGELAQLRHDAEVRGHVLVQREIEIESLVRSRERTIRELEEHLRATTALVNKREVTIKSLESRLSATLSEADGYRQRLAQVIAEAVRKHRTATRPRQRSSIPAKRPPRAARPRAARILTKRPKKKSPSRRKATTARTSR